MSEYISREAALEVFCRWCGICPKEKQKPLECDDILGNVLHSLPAADVRPVVRGKWIIHKPFDSGRHNCNECIECSVCGTWFGHDCYEISNFCPNCGADMREDAKHETTDR